MKKPFFEPKDFIINNDIAGLIYSGSKIHIDAACRIANAKLEKEIQSWPTVYGVEGMPSWSDSIQEDDGCSVSFPDTHTAKLAFIEELPKKECEHVAYIQYSHSGVGCYPMFAICEKCGIGLKATWSEK